MFGSTESAAERDAVAQLDSVTARYGSVTALDDVSLRLRSGAVTVLLGPNGAGKTTLIRLLLGLARPHAGRVRLFGTDPRAPGARQRIGAMMQLAKVPDTLRVVEHLQTFRSYYDRPMELAPLLETVGLSGLERRLYGTLSGGEKQRLMLALALTGDPDLLVLDEPSVGMDAAARRQLWRVIRTLREEGRAVLLTTHYLEEAEALADRVVVLHHGSIIADGSPAQIRGITARRRIRCVTRVAPADLRRLAGVTAVEPDGSAVIITTTTAQAEDALRALLDADPTLHSLEVRGAGLEESFLALTTATLAPVTVHA